MEKRLGRGLGALLGDTKPEEKSADIPLTAIKPNPHQPREKFDPEGLEELRDSIREHGVLQPIAVRRVEGGFEIIAGERRWRAARLAGLKALPAVVRDGVTDEAMLELALVENVQRRDLNPIERARGFQQLVEGLGLTQEEAARKVGLKRATVANHLRLLELPEPVQDALSEGLIAMGHARALLGLSSAKEQIQLAALTARQEFSVREVERRVQNARAATKGAPPAPQPPVREDPPWLQEMQARIGEHLGTRVRVQNGEGYRGKIVIDYFNREDLERLYAVLAPRPSL